MPGQRVKCRRDLARNAGAHQHDVDAGKHRPEERGQRRELHLREEIDPHRSLMPLARLRASELSTNVLLSALDRNRTYI